LVSPNSFQKFCTTRSMMCGSMTWWYVTPSMRYLSHLMMLILFEHLPQIGLGKSIYLLILFSTLLAGYVSSLLFQIVLLSTKWRAYFISIYDYLYIMSHLNLRLKFCPSSINFLAPPLSLYVWVYIGWVNQKTRSSPLKKIQKVGWAR
jgi:hypothetical protein